MCRNKMKMLMLLVATTVSVSSISNVFMYDVQAYEKEISTYVDKEECTVIDVTMFGADSTGRTDSAEAVNKAIEYAKEIDGPKRIYFPKGEYTFYPENTPKRELYVSNTVGTNQNYKVKNIGILIEDMDDVIVDGDGSHFSYHGFQTAFASIRSNNVRFENFSFDYVNPKTVDVTIEGTGNENGKGYRIVYIPETYDYKIENNGINWYGEKSPTTGKYYWTGRNSFNYSQYYNVNTGETKRSGNPIFSNVKNIEQLEDNRVKITYNTSAVSEDEGMIYQMRETTRDTPGAFVWESKDVVIKNINAHYLHGFGIVGQFSENITIDSVNFKSKEGSGRATAGFADFIQMSGTKGKIKINNNDFSNPHDDPINVHGTYLEVKEKIAPNKFKVRYMHNETAGFPQFYVGNEVQFFTKTTMLPVEDSVAKVIDVQGPSGTSSDGSLTDIVITLDKDIPVEVLAGNTHVVENITYTPEVEITNNRFMETPTRGILVTTRKPVLIENNYFDGMGMSSIFISSDAHQWYESGPTNDVVIRNNTFDRSEGPVIYFGPTNQQFNENNPIHNNIVIEDNIFNIKDTIVLDGKSVGNLTFKNNTINRYNTNAEVKISSEVEDLKVGEVTTLNVDALGETFRSPMFNFSGSNNVTIENNKYDNGLNMRINTSNMSNPANNINIVGDNLKINASNQKDGPGIIQYYSSDENVVRVDENGEVVAVGEGTAEVKAFVVSDTRAYESNSITFNIQGEENKKVELKSILGLSNKWSIIREDNSKWRLIDDNSISIMTSGGSLWATGNSANNIFLTDVLEDQNNYTLTCKMKGKTQSGYEEAGIVIYNDDDNYVAIQRKHNNGNPTINVVTEDSGSPNESRVVTDIEQDEIYFKLEKKDNIVKGYYSIDGIQWIQVGKDLTNNGASNNTKVGILTANPNQSHEFVFSDFKINDEKVNFGEEIVSNELGLSDLNINGAGLTTKFDTNIENYNAKVPYSINELDFNVKTLNEETNIEIFLEEEKIADGVGELQVSMPISIEEAKKVYIKVTDANDESKIYTVKLEKFKESKSKLNNIAVTGIDGMPEFNEDRYFYTANGSTNSNTMNISVEGKSPNSNLVILVNGKVYEEVHGNYFNGNIDLVSGYNTVQIYSIAEDGKSKSMYRVSVIRRENNDVKLNSLKINGKEIDGFTSGILNYAYSVDKEVENINVEAIQNNSKSKVEIFNGNTKFEGANVDIPLDLGVNSIVVKVTSEDYSKVNYYKITLNRQFEGNAALESIEIDGDIKLNPEFDANVTNYSIKCPKGINLIKVKAKAMEEKANVSITLDEEKVNYDGNIKESMFYIEENEEIIKINVQAENGDIKEYKIHVDLESSLQIDKSKMTATASSEHPNVGTEGLARFAIDDNLNTLWHTKYSPKDDLPQSITLNLGDEYLVDKFEYIPRQSGGINGIITKYELYLSNDGRNFEKVSEGNWSEDTNAKVINFDGKLATHIKLVALQGVGGFASAAELNVFEKESVPNKPTNLREIEKNNESIKIAWDKPSDKYGLTGYVLFLDGKVLGEVNNDILEYTLDGIEKNKVHTIQVASKNKHGKLSEKANLEVIIYEKLLGDLNNDGGVNIGDLAIASKYYGQEKAEYDLNGDNIVDEYELNIISKIIFEK